MLMLHKAVLSDKVVGCREQISFKWREDHKHMMTTSSSSLIGARGL